jgi:hypothetical protein
MTETWQWRVDAGTPSPINSGNPLPREEAQRRKRERLAERREELGARLLNPPPLEFSRASQQLARDIKTVVDLLDSAAAVLIVGWVTLLLITPTPETFVTAGYDPTDLAKAFEALGSIERGKIRDLVTAELIKQPPTLSYDERKFWDALRRATYIER